jgi:ATP-binding cassette subfamily B protein
MNKKFPFFRQLDAMDCGPTCLRMIAKFYGRVYSAQFLREKCFIGIEGASMLSLTDAAEAIGLRPLTVTVPFETLEEEVPMPCIAHWRQRHFIVVYAIKKGIVYVADPGYGLIKYTTAQFVDGWLQNTRNSENPEGLLMLLEPTPDFFENEEKQKKSGLGLKFLLPYFRPYKKYLIQLLLGLLVGSVIQLVFPLLTQTVVDYGINNQNLSFISLILAAQLMLFFSQIIVEFIRSWLLLHMGARINISIISDFLFKVMRLPISFFNSKETADILQRIQDHERIATFLSASTLTVLFSIFNLLILGTVLAYYNITILFIFLGGTVIYVIWVMAFMKKRAELDYRRFDQQSEGRSNVLQLIYGMEEIKLNNSEKRRRWEWEAIQIKLFKISVKGLALEQAQSLGAFFINQLKNIIITFFAAKAVITGQMTLGMMLAAEYILGQLNAPINNFISFVQTTQNARISLERLGEVHDNADEEDRMETKITTLPANKSITISDQMCFQYGGPKSAMVLKNIDLVIPRGKITAIVGASGSGKTTLLKLLLKFYEPTSGKLAVGNTSLDEISVKTWREKCGVVMQGGFIFADTISRNITESSSEGTIDRERLRLAARIANIEEFIEALPNGYNTRVSLGGITLSGGERQRVLIARAVYKNPDYLFFDEATSALDANNEKVIMKNLQEFQKGKTVVVIAHRLSTVKSADQIVVLDHGKIIEQGTHEELTHMRTAYFTLVKNQLELGN